METKSFICPHCLKQTDLGREYFGQDSLRRFHGDFDVVFCTGCKKVVGTLIPYQLQLDLERFLKAQKPAR